MSIIDQLASASGRRDEALNKELAERIAVRKDLSAIEELVENLDNKKKDIQSDCIKTLYEIAALDSSLIAPYADRFIGLLDSRNNRLQWGAMTALDAVASIVPGKIYEALPKLAAVTDKGSVITRDHYVGILCKLCAVEAYKKHVFPLLKEQLLSCPPNQLPMYAEMALPVIDKDNKESFVNTVSSRITDLEKESKRKRVEKVLKKVAQTR